MSLSSPCYPLGFTNTKRLIPFSIRHLCHTSKLTVSSLSSSAIVGRDSLPSPESVWTISCSSSSDTVPKSSIKWPRTLVQLSASSVLLLGLGFFAFSSPARARSSPNPTLFESAPATPGSRTVLDERVECESQPVRDKNEVTPVADDMKTEELDKAFESWKTKTFALTVPLRIVALGASVPPLWMKEFIRSQGRKMKFGLEFRRSLEDIFSELIEPSGKGRSKSESTVGADLVTVGDSWLQLAISKSIIEPIQMVEDKDWFKGLSEKWKVYLRRNNDGNIDADGKIWAIPYRWGSMMIMYNKRKFEQSGLEPIEDWADLWRPDLSGRISMISCPREVIGAVLKYMGASYNTKNIDAEVPGGINAVQEKLHLLAKQVRLFDSNSYLKAFKESDVWVAVGWSSDVLPAAKRMSGVAVVIPKSGASLWADLWAVPATSRCDNQTLGGRARGPSPLIHQWFEFCLQPAREFPFKQEVVPGASPSSLGVALPFSLSEMPVKDGRPKLTSNLIAGVPPPDILDKCEFLHPLCEDALLDYQSLVSCIQNPASGYGKRIQELTSTMIRGAQMKLWLNK